MGLNISGVLLDNLSKWLKFRDLGRNDKCACGSGKKYKKCCINIDWSKELALVEGAFDLVKSNENSTCLLGSKLSEKSRLFLQIIKNNKLSYSFSLSFENFIIFRVGKLYKKVKLL